MTVESVLRRHLLGRRFGNGVSESDIAFLLMAMPAWARNKPFMPAAPPAQAQASFTVEVTEELARARSKFDRINSLHEGYAVIAEELDEFWEDVRGKEPERLNRAYRELVQVAAMAQRTAEDVIAKDRPDASFDPLYRGVRLIDVERLAKALISSDLLARYSEYAIKAGVPKEPADLLANAWAHHIAVAYYGQVTDD